VPDGLSTIRLTFDPCDRGAASVYRATAVDAAGLSSDAHSTTYTLSGAAMRVGDPGNVFAAAEDLGTISAPITLCGSISNADNDGTAYRGDVDFLRFVPSATAEWSASLTWDSITSDYDMALLNASGQFIVDAYIDGTTQPETMAHGVAAGVSYYLRIAGWSGEPGGWRVELE